MDRADLLPRRRDDPRRRDAPVITSYSIHYTKLYDYGLPELRDELARTYYKRYGLDYDPASEILVTTGVSEALDIAIRAVVNPGDEVIVVQPS